MKVPFSPPDIGEAEIAEVVDTLRSGWITTGKKTKQFERDLAQYCHTARAACMNSQTATAEMTLRLLGIGPGDEVITTAYTYTASASVICHVGARPVLIDVAKDSYEMDYDALEAAVNERTKAIIPVDVGGIMCDYARVYDIVRRKQGLFRPTSDLQRAFGRIIVIADGAHSLGAVRDGKISGEAADFTCFSFHAIKNLTTAEGGAVTWLPLPGMDDEDLYRQYMLLSLHGQNKDALKKNRPGDWEYDIIGTYYKCNMTDMQASLGLAQLKRYAAILDRRHEIIRRYDARLAGHGLRLLQHTGDGFRSSGHLYIVRVEGAGEQERNEIIAQMGEREVACNVHYKPLPMFTAYRNMGFDIKDYPNAFDLYRNAISLPLNTCLSDEQVEYVADCLLDILGR